MTSSLLRVLKIIKFYIKSNNQLHKYSILLYIACSERVYL
jgi:hypothetical protein